MIELRKCVHSTDTYYLTQDGKPKIVYRWIMHRTLEALVRNAKDFGIDNEEGNNISISNDEILKSYETLQDFIDDHIELLI